MLTTKASNGIAKKKTVNEVTKQEICHFTYTQIACYGDHIIIN